MKQHRAFQRNLKDFDIRSLETLLVEMGEPAYRAKQIMDWLYKGVKDFDSMKNIPISLRKKLEEGFTTGAAAVLCQQISKEDGTRKVLFELADGEGVESVLMKYRYGNSVCVSSQAGCAMGCHFCASGLLGKARDLTAGEMMDQIVSMADLAKTPVGHMVVMGTGEPFDNYENVAQFLRICHGEEGYGMSYRHMTVSTVGLVEGIKRFGEEFPQVNLAISLHASNDAIRQQIMPINRRYPVGEVLAAAHQHSKKTGRRVTFEYGMMAGVNDGTDQAAELARRLKGMLCHVNLIPLNPVEESPYKGSEKEVVIAFQRELEKRQISVTVRREMGQDIQAACGQLRLAANKGLSV
jgi:23S rRNA (adenine2503-C2)-methyltransferase